LGLINRGGQTWNPPRLIVASLTYPARQATAMVNKLTVVAGVMYLPQLMSINRGNCDTTTANVNPLTVVGPLKQPPRLMGD
jgi:biotin-(acetyl-CoA carboxylase) ligase